MIMNDANRDATFQSTNDINWIDLDLGRLMSSTVLVGLNVEPRATAIENRHLSTVISMNMPSPNSNDRVRYKYLTCQSFETPCLEK